MLYSYYCPVCEKAHDVQKPIKDFYNEERCPDCKEIMERQISKPAISFKGPGFYVNDYPKGQK